MEPTIRIRFWASSLSIQTSTRCQRAKITTQNYDAEFGKAVSSFVTAQTKSGSNKFHGSAFDYRQSGANLAKDPFTQGPGRASIPRQLKNQFGGSIGGPIIKDKLFFFGDYQGVRQKVGTANVQTVPSALAGRDMPGQTGEPERNSGLRLQRVCCECDSDVVAGIIYQADGTRYPGNVIPAALVSQQAKNFF